MHCIAYVRKKKDIIITIHKFLQKPFSFSISFFFPKFFMHAWQQFQL